MVRPVRPLVAWVLSLLLAAGLSACGDGGGSPTPPDGPAPTWRSPEEPHSPLPSPYGAVTRTEVAFGDHPAQVMDVFHPDTDVPSPTGDAGRRPAMVLVHGGGWISGNRGYHHATAASLAALGWVAVTVEYRLAPDHPHPAAAEDVRAALGAVDDRADDLGLDRDRVVLAGDSAGGHLAALVATADGRPPVAAWVAWSGIYDLVRLPDRLADEHAWLADNVQAYVGCDLVTPTCADTAADASPITHLDADDPPGILAHATDELVPLTDAEAMAAAAEDAGATVRLVIRPGRTHGAALIEETTDDVGAFLTDVLSLEREEEG